ncbi:uncharacterized protein LOC111572730 isoform X1 [Amphiprion ocellaris]|uniref:Sleeping Beauty transposase HTH domain-containing protein n=1 Tax=Amphiprion ocellaris TaxID=80972 RepID=A0AAQ5X081_AMPOC|nr:uncharacterized protein LOC111572730 isoform X1 [Amphiprion ocellaris]
MMPRSKETQEHMRNQVIDIYQSGKGYKSIAKALGLQRTTVRAIIQKWRKHGTVVNLPRSGRPTNVSIRARQRLIQEVTTEPRQTSEELQASLALVQADQVSAGPTDDTEGDPDDEKTDSNTVPEVGQNTSPSSSDIEEDPTLSGDHASAGPTDDREGDPDHDMLSVRDYSTVEDDGESTDSSSSDTEATDEDPMADYVSAGLTDDRGGDPEYDMYGEEISPVSSDDETAEEDPMEQLFDFNEEKKIYAGSSVTTGALLLLLVVFILKHGLSKAATKDLLDLLNFMVPGCVPKSWHFFKKHLTDSSPTTELHFYCPRCTSYLGVDPGDECLVCQKSLSRKGLLEKAYYFLVMPLEIQLRNILANIHEKLGKHFTREASISDVNTGSKYKRDRQDASITLSFNCKGSPVSNSSKFSVWPILCTINELPYVDRCKNVLLHTLWFGRGKPQVQSFFTPFINEVQKLSEEGFYWRDEDGFERHTRVTARVCVCDTVARAMLQNFKPFNREFGCGFCYHKGEMVQTGSGYTRIYPIQVDGCDLRHMVETVQIAEFVMENDDDEHQMGVKGPSPLILLPFFDIIQGFIPDYMHCVCLGVTRQFVNLWFDPLYANKGFHLTHLHLSNLDKAVHEIQPPDEIGQGPRRLSERMYWKASEWRAFALLYSPIILRNVLPALYYKHWMLLVCALHTLLSQFATQDELNCAELCLVQFVAKIPSLYGLEHCSYNCHLLTHLSESARDWGLLWANSAFVYESMNNRLLQMFSGTKSVSSQIFKNFFSYEKVVRKGSAVLEDASTKLKDIFCSVTSCDVVSKSSDCIGEHLVTLGCGSCRYLSTREVAALQKSDTLAWCHRHCESVTEYKRCVYKNMLVTSSDDSVAVKRNNSVIETTSCFALVESLVVVQKPCSCEGAANCYCRELIIFYKQLQPISRQLVINVSQINANIAKFLVKVKRSNELCAMTCVDITAKCVMIESEGQLYVMKMPVF